jgi:hypothetical protein
MKQPADRLDPMLSSPPSILNARANYIGGKLRTPGATRHIDDEQFSTATLRPATQTFISSAQRAALLVGSSVIQLDALNRDIILVENFQ